MPPNKEIESHGAYGGNFRWVRHQEPFALYLTLIVVVFAIASLVGPRRCYGLRTSSKEEELLYETIALGFVSVACLVLGAVLGLSTRNY